MRLVITTLLSCLVSTLSFAQWSSTNPVTTFSNVGIGTTQPLRKFHIQDGNNMQIYLGLHSGDPALILSRWTGVGSNYQTSILHPLWNGAGFGLAFSMVGTHTDDNFSSSSTKMYLAQDGNLGIGTTTPGTFKLAVNGKIWTHEVNVAMTNPGPDYVFEKEYDLLSLSELETYIKQNKHLPEVPSAKEMEANGLNLKEMNLLLLKKVEELTLHIIKQQKRIDNQQTQITKLQTNNK